MSATTTQVTETGDAVGGDRAVGDGSGNGRLDLVDARIAGAAAFAQPILRHLRELVHRACPEIEEAVKWSRPVFLYRGRILCFMAAFTKHCSFGFWGQEMAGVLRSAGMPVDDAGGSLGRLGALTDLPADEKMLDWIRKAAELSESGAGIRRARVRRAAVELPQELETAMGDRPEAAANFFAMTPGYRREYAMWIAEAKRPETRARRVAETLARVTEGKTRYEGRSR